MGTLRSFQDMLNEYLPNELLKEELLKRDYVLQKVQKDNNWKGGKIIVPFKAAGASSVKFNKLTASNDIAQAQYIRGSIDSYKEVWGTMMFYDTDLKQHNGKIPESTFLKILPDTIEDFMATFKELVSLQLTAGPHFAAVVDATNAGTGILVVDRVDRFMLGQKCAVALGTASPTDIYVTAINLETSAVTFSLSRGGVAADLSAYTVAGNSKFYFDGVNDAGTISTFSSIKDALLSAANGGSANLHGKSKLAYPFLQAINIDGSGVSASNIFEKIFDAYADIRQKARGNASDILMSYRNLGWCIKKLEDVKGAYKVVEGSRKATVYGWTEIQIMDIATQTMLKFVGIQEFDNDIIVFMDWTALTFRTNGFFQKRKDPQSGNEYYVERTVNGYSYIIDISLFGELEFTKPGQCGIMHSIPA